MKKIEIEWENIKGVVSYRKKDKVIIVSFSDTQKKKEIEKYLSSRQKFKIPESQIIDDYRVDNVLPSEAEIYFDLALNTLYTKTGVKVNW